MHVNPRKDDALMLRVVLVLLAGLVALGFARPLWRWLRAWAQ